MAFCNSCGAQIAAGTKFCNSCGAAVSGAPAAAAPPPVAATPQPVSVVPAPPASSGGGSALKIILIIIGVIVLIAILGMATCSFVAYRAVKHASDRMHIKEEGGHVKVETLFGSAETSTDPGQVAKDLGVDIYPGAEVQKNGASSATFGPIHTVTGMFTSTDSMDKVCSFYKEKFPNAMTSSADTGHCTIVSTDDQKKDMITVNVESSGDSSKIQITRVTKSH